MDQLWRTVWMWTLCCGLFTAAAQAQDVVLTSRDGSIRLEGSMLSYDGEFYRIESGYGVLTLDSQGVDCTGPGCPDIGGFVPAVRIAGAPAMGEVLLPALVEGFARSKGLGLRRSARSDLSFDYGLIDETTGQAVSVFEFRLESTGSGLRALSKESADLALSVREALPDERLPEEARRPLRERIIALDALVPVVSRFNPTTSLPLADVLSLFSGEIKTWDGPATELGPVSLHLGTEDDGFVQNFAAVLEAETGLAPVDDALRYAAASDLVDQVAREPGAIGLTRLSELGNARAVALTGACGRRLEATERTVKAEDYPLTTPLFVYAPPRRLPLAAREFLEWLDGPAAQLIVRRSGFVDLGPLKTSLDSQGERLTNAILAAGEEVDLEEIQRLASTMRGTERLTVSFRFRGGAATLDPQSKENIRLLARDLEAGIYDGRELILAGFSDGQGGAEVNQRISIRRARAVREALRELAPAGDWNAVKLTVSGFGEAMPMACDDSEWGRRVNRRVEVWLR